MDEKTITCRFIPNCPMYKHFTSEGIKRLFILQYCEAGFDRCERFKLKSEGKEAPDKLLPNGDMLE